MLPVKMVSPRERRPGVWRGGVLQIWVTRACDLACTACTQGSNLAGKPDMMTPDQFEEAILSLCEWQEWDENQGKNLTHPGYWGVVGIFGGNPCVHPQFDELCRILRKWIPYDQRGLWSNNLNGHGVTCRKTFNPDVSNLNVHLNSEAYEEMLRDWPLCMPKGLYEDSLHSPPFVALQDMEDMNDAERWSAIGNCTVNKRWSALIGVFRGHLRAWFCELAGAQAMLHAHERDYPDTGSEVTPGWWNQGIEAFEAQVRYHCFACGIPLNGRGDFARFGTAEYVSKTHASIYKPKVRGREVKLVTKRSELGATVSAATQYLSTECP